MFIDRKRICVLLALCASCFATTFLRNFCSVVGLVIEFEKSALCVLFLAVDQRQLLPELYRRNKEAVTLITRFKSDKALLEQQVSAVKRELSRLRSVVEKTLEGDAGDVTVYGRSRASKTPARLGVRMLILLGMRLSACNWVCFA